MHTETRKINLIEAVLKISNEATLSELETVVKKSKKIEEKKRLSAHDFLGVWSHQDAELISKAIEESCEQIDQDDWK
jgi:hypothetical protein